MYRAQPKGFIALISALIISLVLLLIASGGSISGFYTRVNSLSSEYKEQSQALADACVSHTLLALALDAAYAGSATTTVGDAACYTGPITVSGSAPNQSFSFSAQAYFNDAYTFLSVSAQAPDFAITSYEERASF
jgi:hypothetical protein